MALDLRFLDGDDKSYDSATRAHVLRNHFRNRPVPRKATKASSQNESAVSVAAVSALTKQQDSHQEDSPPSSGENDASSDDENPDLQSPPSTGVYSSQALARQPILEASPLSPMSAGNYDPFSTFARKVNDRESFLMDYYVRDVMQFFKGSSVTLIHPPRDQCFHANIRGLAPIDIMLSYASGHLANRYGLPRTEAEMYQARGIRLLRQEIADPKLSLSDSTIISVVGLISFTTEIKRRRFSKSETIALRSHIQGLRNLIILRGGFPQFVSDSTVQWIVSYVDLTTSGALSIGWTPPSDHFFLLSSSEVLAITRPKENDGFRNSPYPTDLSNLTSEFFGAYKDFHHEAVRRGELRESNRPLKSSVLLIDDLFRKDTSLRRLMTAPSSVVTLSHVVILLLLNLVLWDHRICLPELSSVYFTQIRHAMVDQGLDLGGSVDQLVWIFMTQINSRQVRDAERLWVMVRLLYVHERLSKATQERCKNVLLQFLLGDENGCSAYRKMLVWSFDDFKNLILKDLNLVVE